MPRPLAFVLALAACASSAPPAPDPAPARPAAAPPAPAPSTSTSSAAPPPPVSAGLTPADSDRLTGPAALDPRTLEPAFEALLAQHGIPLIEETHFNSVDGPDRQPPDEHPSIKTSFRIGPCSPAEAWWLFASYTGVDWFPAPDSRSLPWKAGESPDQEVAILDDPDKPEHLWIHQLQVLRESATGRVTLLTYIQRSEGSGASRFMKRVDDTTWILEDVMFAD